MAGIWFYFVFLISVVRVAQACKCATRHPQSVFCNTDFAIRAKVMTKSLGNRRVYQIRILKVFSDKTTQVGLVPRKSASNRTRDIYTSASSASCGVRLDNSSQYLLAGYVRNHEMRINSCDFPLIKKWSDVTLQQRRGLRRFYGENCKCRMAKRCFGTRCSGQLMGCEAADRDYKVTICKKKYSFCVKTASGNQCEWKRTQDFKKCVSKE